jgi:hypothetical protein
MNLRLIKISLLLLFCLFFTFSCKIKKPYTETTEIKKPERFQKLMIEKVPTVKKSIAYHLGKRLLETCNTSRFKVYTAAEATEKVIKNATVDKISQTCKKINLRNGKFIDMELTEVIHDTETDDYFFRYEILFEKKFYRRALNLTLNSENKIAAISTKEVPKKPL